MLSDRVAAVLEHCDDAVVADQVQGADDDQNVGVAVEQGFDHVGPAKVPVNDDFLIDVWKLLKTLEQHGLELF